MSEEIAKTGKKVDFVIVNADNAVDDVANLVSKCSFPIFQDTEKVGVWKAMGGSKDDFYVYDSAGKLVHFLPFGGTVGTDLGKQSDFDGIKKLVLAVK